MQECRAQECVVVRIATVNAGRRDARRRCDSGYRRALKVNAINDVDCRSQQSLSSRTAASLLGSEYSAHGLESSQQAANMRV